MKFLTYKEHNNPNQIFGFKYKEELMISINQQRISSINILMIGLSPYPKH